MSHLKPLFHKKKICLFLAALIFAGSVFSQVTFPVNGVADPREGSFAFTNATIIKVGQPELTNATMLIRQGKIVAIGANITIPKTAVVIDCKGKYIYPSFIDIYSDYGMPPAAPRTGGFDFRAPVQLSSSTKGVSNWNQAVKPEADGFRIFAADNSKAKPYREAGFGTVLTHRKDGIARGTGVFVTLADENENLLILKEKASANYSFNKGTSTQSYPSSLMGSIALLRQTYLDALWYKTKPAREGVNVSLQAWTENQNLPQIFDASDKWNDLRADRIGDEFGVQYIIKAGGNEYQRIKEIAATKAPYIVPLNFPKAFDVEDVNDARLVSLSDMKHWEMAPTNPAAFEKANIPFCLTTADLSGMKQFHTNLRKAFDYGLSEGKALEALTKTPATLLGMYDQVGSLDVGKVANFLITNGPVFNEKTSVLQNWIQGARYNVNADEWNDIKGTYLVNITTAGGTSNQFTLDVKSSSSATMIGKDTFSTRFSSDGQLVKIIFSAAPAGKKSQAEANSAADGNAQPGSGKGASIRLNGAMNGTTWQGNGEDTTGARLTWTATLQKAAVASKEDSAGKTTDVNIGKITYPFTGYGWEELPVQQNLLFKNATVWTNEKEGRLENTDVLVKNGKIAQVGKNLSDASAKSIDATGKYLTPGIIDEHSHIASASINEGGQSVTSEVRIADNLNPEDINIYSQLGGGV
ncbi:MAG TPA: amidohydrolase family protein, partial [Chitinophagaceae bacterium]|nr:amidohydrolase family protein [Chitinophagaceae bacterium]